MSEEIIDNIIENVIIPTRLEYRMTPGMATARFLKGMTERRILGERCPVCAKVYVPPRGSCATCAVATEEEVELAGTGTVTSFCVVNLQFYGSALEVPYVCASVLLDGSDLPFFGMVGGMPWSEVRMGLRVTAEWVHDADLGPTFESIKYFKPTGEPDAAFETYKEHL
ncbi:MAG: putative OB-fold protein [Hyphomicrobiaceae bacterium]|jgi:uncharacterized OB-fold protein